tara:strand:- start:651 stop:1226 length:576 start_codon:yes stop_codon:yes gene_type:complete
MYGDLQFFDIIIFAAIAAFIIYRLRSVLGKRTGFEGRPKQTKNIKPTNIDKKNIPVLKDNESKLEEAYKSVENFDHKTFLEGAKKAFEIIITAFNSGDKTTLKQLVSKDVFKAFEDAIDNNNNNPSSQFYSLIIDNIESVKIENGLINISVKFISEQIMDNNEDAIVKNTDTWTFEKKINSSDPKWTLVST